ncbi:MAG: tetratricopeptide repeat protein [Flavobacteriales bacterium]
MLYFAGLAQNHSDTLKFFIKKKNYIEGLRYCQKNNLFENATGEENYYAAILYDKNNKLCESSRLFIRIVNQPCDKKHLKKANKFLALNKTLYDSTIYYYSKAYKAHESKEFEKAHQYLDLVLKNDPHFTDALQFMLIIAVEEKNEKNIQHYFDLVKKENPFFEKCYRTVGTYYRDNNEFNKAMVVYADFLKVDEASGNFGIAGVYFDQEKYDKAMEYYRKSYAVGKDKAAFFNIGLCYKYLKQYDQAIKVFLNLMKTDYDNGRLNEEVANCYYDIDDYDTAIKYYQVAIKGNPKSDWSYYWMGLCYYYKGNKVEWDNGKGKEEKEMLFNKAFDCVNKASLLKPGNPKYHLWKAEVIEYSSRRAERTTYLKEALRLDSNDSKYWHSYISGCRDSDIPFKKIGPIAAAGVEHFKSHLNNPQYDHAKTLYAIGNLYGDWHSVIYENKLLSDSALHYIKSAYIEDTANTEYFKTLFWYMQDGNKMDTAICFDYLRRHPNDFEQWYETFVEFCINKQYEYANVIYVQVNTLFPASDLAKGINYEVRFFKKKYKWSDICQKQECVYYDKYTHLDFFKGPYAVIPH